MMTESHLRKETPQFQTTPPRLDLEENRDPDPDRINLNPVDPELNPIAPEGPVIPNIPEVIPEPNPEPIPEVIPEDPELLEPEPEVIPPEIIEDIEMPAGDQPKYQLRDLPKFGGEKIQLNLYTSLRIFSGISVMK